MEKNEPASMTIPVLETNLRRESNNMNKINFLMGGDFKAKAADGISDTDARGKFFFSMRVGDVLEPHYFVRDKPTLTLN